MTLNSWICNRVPEGPGSFQSAKLRRLLNAGELYAIGDFTDIVPLLNTGLQGSVKTVSAGHADIKRVSRKPGYLAALSVALAKLVVTTTKTRITNIASCIG